VTARRRNSAPPRGARAKSRSTPMAGPPPIPVSAWMISLGRLVRTEEGDVALVHGRSPDPTSVVWHRAKKPARAFRRSAVPRSLRVRPGNGRSCLPGDWVCRRHRQNHTTPAEGGCQYKGSKRCGGMPQISGYLLRRLRGPTPAGCTEPRGGGPVRGLRRGRGRDRPRTPRW
jgi:hypothetical protein